MAVEINWTICVNKSYSRDCKGCVKKRGQPFTTATGPRLATFHFKIDRLFIIDMADRPGSFRHVPFP
jgi:hypothetical protein